MGKYTDALDLEEYLDGHVLSIPEVTSDHRKIKSLSELDFHYDVDFLSSITKLEIPPMLDYCDISFLWKLPELSKLTSTEQRNFKIHSNIVTTTDGDEIIYVPPFVKHGRMFVNNPLKAIRSNAFKNNATVRLMVLQSPSMNIGKYAFEGCRGLRKILSCCSALEIEDYAFKNVSKDVDLIVKGKLAADPAGMCKGYNGNLKIYLEVGSNQDFIKSLSRKGVHNITVYEYEHKVFSLLIRNEIGVKRPDAVSMTVFPYSRKIETVSLKQKPDRKSTALYLPLNSTVIVVCKNKFPCLSRGHHLVDRQVAVRLLSPEREIVQYTLNLGFCRECGKYYIYHSIYEDTLAEYFKNPGWKILGCSFQLLNGKRVGNTFAMKNGMIAESVLKVCGYTVGHSKGLPEEERLKILTGIIQHGLLTKQEVMNYLNWFITTRKNISNMEKAISDWKNDLKKLNEMKFK